MHQGVQGDERESYDWLGLSLTIACFLADAEGADGSLSFSKYVGDNSSTSQLGAVKREELANSTLYVTLPAGQYRLRITVTGRDILLDIHNITSQTGECTQGTS